MDLDIEIDTLMMAALDGTITARDRARLEAHFNYHPEQRTAFERMLRVDLALRQMEPAAPPVDFSQRVMASTRAVRIARPITGRHLAAFIATNSVLMMLAWLISGIALVALVAFVAQQPPVQTAQVLARSAAVYIADLLGLFSSAIHAAVNQPLFWIGVVSLAALVIAWMSLMVKVLRPARRYAR
jgi:anti-sigma factor RsiW